MSGSLGIVSMIWGELGCFVKYAKASVSTQPQPEIASRIRSNRIMPAKVLGCGCEP